MNNRRERCTRCNSAAYVAGSNHVLAIAAQRASKNSMAPRRSYPLIAVAVLRRQVATFGARIVLELGSLNDLASTLGNYVLRTCENSIGGLIPHILIPRQGRGRWCLFGSPSRVGSTDSPWSPSELIAFDDSLTELGVQTPSRSPTSTSSQASVSGV